VAEPVDVVIVGARCAGASLACHLARAGLDVVVVDRADFPSDTPSTHFFQAEGLLALQRLGVMDRLLATGAPLIEHFLGSVDAAEFGGRWPLRDGDVAGAMCVRRPLLDSMLVDAAREAGADVRLRTVVRGVVRDGDRVVGVEVDGEGEGEIRARLVVGADGRTSTVARSVGARRYHATTSPRAFSWGYFDVDAIESPPRAHFHRQGDDFVVASPCDGGELMVVAAVSKQRYEDEFDRDAEAMHAAVVAAVPAIASITAGARPTDKIHTVTRYDGFLRESAGPGWVLVGDAGHFKDPTPGQGISDALRQVEQLSPEIVAGVRQGDLDARMQAWWRWRDDDAFEKHWFASDLGRAGPVLTVEREILSRLVSTPRGQDMFIEILNHRVKPSRALTPTRLVAATARLLARRGTDRRQVLRDARTLVAQEGRRRMLRRRPEYEGADAA
jgi:2-polyprenyl-6-methoxyphenol hydroxylase-like FAD-dependent oxidoreductase